MPSQEPQLDDKNDEADIPTEENDGSKYQKQSQPPLLLLWLASFVIGPHHLPKKFKSPAVYCAHKIVIALEETCRGLSD